MKPYLLMLSSSSESPKLVLSSSLVMRVEELSYPARWRSSLEGTPGLWPPAPCSLLSLLLGRSRLSDMTDSVSVSGSRFSWLLDTLGWKDGGLESPMPLVLSGGKGGNGGGGGTISVRDSWGGGAVSGWGLSDDTSQETTLPLKQGRRALSSEISSFTTPKSWSIDLKKYLAPAGRCKTLLKSPSVMRSAGTGIFTR